MQINPIVIVEDDFEDCEMLTDTFREMGEPKEFRCFDNAVSALIYLRETKETPLIIISDINMPYIDGLSFKKLINEEKLIIQRRIPFVYLSTSKDESLIKKAFELSIQGFFRKPTDMESLKDIVMAIIAYWPKAAFHMND